MFGNSNHKPVSRPGKSGDDVRDTILRLKIQPDVLLKFERKRRPSRDPDPRREGKVQKTDALDSATQRWSLGSKSAAANYIDLTGQGSEDEDEVPLAQRPRVQRARYYSAVLKEEEEQEEGAEEAASITKQNCPQHEVSRLRAELAQCRSQLKQQTDRADKEHTEVARLKRENESSQKEVRLYRRHAEQEGQKLVEVTTKLRTAETQYHNARDESSSFQNKLDTSTRKEVTLAKERARFLQQVQSMKDEFANLNSRCDSLQQANERLQKEASRNGDRSTLLNADKRALEKDIEIERKRQADLEKNYETLLQNAYAETQRVKAELEKAHDATNQVRAKREIQETLQAEVLALKESKKDEQNTHDELLRHCETLERDLKDETTAHTATKGILETLQSKNASLEQELLVGKNGRADLKKQLDDANEKLKEFQAAKDLDEQLKRAKKTPTPLPNSEHCKRSPTIEPATSSTAASDLDQKIQNIQKVYFNVKKKYDKLFFISKDITISTRSMNLSNFGEFGAYLKQLRSAMEEVEEKASEQ